MLPPAALLLADPRLPAGAHAHSTGLESAAAAAAVTDIASLRAYTLGRLWTTGLTGAALAAATLRACEGARSGPMDWLALDAEAGARVASPALREASRRLGRQLLRAARAAWPDPLLDAVSAALPAGAHQPVALGAAGAAAGLDAHGVALCAGYQTVTEATGAALRLLGLDPYAVARLVAELLEEVEAVAENAAAARPLADLPCPSSPLLDAGAQDHATWEVRLFAS